MQSSNGKHSKKKMGLRHKLLLIETLIFVLPFLVVFYMFYTSKITVNLSHMVLMALILLLVLASLILLRQIFDKIINISTSIKMAEDGDKHSIAIQQDTHELHEIAVSFNNLLEKFEKSTNELKRRTFELFTIKELIESTSKSLDIEEMFNLLLDKAMAVSNAQIGSVLSVQTKEERFRVVAYKGAEPGPEKYSHIKIGDSIVKQVFTEKKPLLVQNIETDPRTQKSNDPKYKSPSFLSMPILVKNNLMGILNLTEKENQELFDSDDEQILSIMIGEIGFALENAMLHSSIKEHLKNLEERSAELTITNEQLQQEIDERKRIEETLQKYKQIVSSVKEHILFIDKNYVCQAVNEAYLQAHNKETREIISKSLPEVIGRKMFDEQVKEKLDRCLTGEEVRYQYWHTFPVVGRRFMDVVYYPFVEEERSVSGIVVAAKDFTKTKQLENQLLHAQKMEAMGTMAAGVAHNFNNLLMAIQGNASLMLLGTDKSHKNYSMLKNIEKQIQSGSEITRQLLGYTQKGLYEAKPISLNHLIRDTSETFGEAKKEISICLDLADDLLGILADRGQIEQILLNLYLNAADAMLSGGKLTLRTSNTTHEQIMNKQYNPTPGKYAFLQVSDTGFGIDKETQKRIFEPFFTTKTMDRGTGLGLASVYGIVKGHGGYIDVESEENKGTTFNIYLPASEKKVELLSEASAPFRKGSETILAVDDEKMILKTTVRMLTKLGYTVLKAENGNEALEIYEEKKDKIDLVILDMIMPDMIGGEVFDRMKKINKNVNVLLSSGYSIDGQAEEIMERGCNGFIQKPYNFKDLSQKIREILDKR